MRVINGPTFANVYGKLLNELYNNPDTEQESRGQLCKEIGPAILNIDSLKYSLFRNTIRSSQERYIINELLWYWSGDNRVDRIGKHAQMWNNIKNSDDTVNSAYGHRVLEIKNKYGYTQMEWVLDSLKRDKHSRQAYLLFTDPDIQYKNNKDVICTVYAHFTIRDNRLNMTVHMRSNDVIYGLPNDVPFFSTIQQYVRLSLREHIYRDLEYGNYIHIADSLHLYSRHYNMVDNMLKHSFNESGLPAMRYPKEWDMYRHGQTPLHLNDYLLRYLINNGTL